MQYYRKLNITLVPSRVKSPVRGQVPGPEHVYRAFKGIKDSAQETCIAVFLNSKLEVCAYDVLSLGTKSETLVDPADVFGRAYVQRSAYFILVHNHPSGLAEPSPGDRLMMADLAPKAKIMGVKFLDFIIVGDDEYWSMFDAMEGGEYATGAFI